MERKTYYTSIIIDKYDNTIEQYRIYGDGIIIALIDNNGYVSYNYKEAKLCANVQEAIKLFIEKLKKERKKVQYYIDY